MIDGGKLTISAENVPAGGLPVPGDHDDVLYVALTAGVGEGTRIYLFIPTAAARP